jgi:Ca2+-binding EF-hand superfamily protein
MPIQWEEWEVSSRADTKRILSKETFQQYVSHSEEQYVSGFFAEDFKTIKKDVPRTHGMSHTHDSAFASAIFYTVGILWLGNSFDQPSLRDLVVAAEETVAGDSAMRRILMAYVVRNHSPGYAQGLNFLTKVLLTITKDEERSFWLLNTFVEDVMIRDFFCRPPSGMNGFSIMLATFKCIGVQLLPSAKEAIGEDMLKFYLELLLARWAIKALVDIVPLEAMLVVWRHLFRVGASPSDPCDHPCISGKYAPFVAVIALIDLALMANGNDGFKDIEGMALIDLAASKVTAAAMEASMAKLEGQLEAAGGVHVMDAAVEAEKQRLAAKWASGQSLSSLEQHSHFTEAQLQHLLQHFQTIKKASGCISKQQFVSTVTEVNPKLPPDFVVSTFELFDGDDSGEADFKELVAVLSVVQRGTLKERLQLCFDAFDHDHSGFLEREEVADLVACLVKVPVAIAAAAAAAVVAGSSR